MHDQPSLAELLQAVKHFIDETASPNLSGHPAFHARVASNVLATALRDLEVRTANESAEAASLKTLLAVSDGRSLDDMNRELCKRIQSGDLTATSHGLIAHLKATTIAQVKTDQPRYSGLKTAES